MSNVSVRAAGALPVDSAQFAHKLDEYDRLSKQEASQDATEKYRISLEKSEIKRQLGGESAIAEGRYAKNNIFGADINKKEAMTEFIRPTPPQATGQTLDQVG